MIDTAELKALLARVEGAEGADGQLDDDLWKALCWKEHYREIARGAAAFTSSIDAALALTERVLPGWLVEISGRDSVWECELNSLDGRFLAGGDTKGLAFNKKTPALAIIAALLKAKIAEAESE